MSIVTVIPSKTWSNLKPCVDAVREREQGYRIIVVDDGIDPMCRVAMEYNDHRVKFIDGVQGFIYARNCNLGIREALKDPGCEGVVLLNDDALLETPGGFSAMAHACHELPEYGVMSAVTKYAGNPQQFPKGIGVREAQRVVAFVCVYLPRTTFDAVGLLDERYGGVDEFGRTIYGWDDNDMCRRIRMAGMKLGIDDYCVVDHGSLKSTFRGDARAAGDIEPGRRVYMAKWGDCN